MGNLLGAPKTEKETIKGTVGQGVEFAVTSMQGWRIHMEDAHIAESRLYASELGKDGTYTKIDLPGHSIFAIFDGHGGTFAALYAGRNLCRVLSRQPAFVEYAKFEKERASKEGSFNSSSERAQYIHSGLMLLKNGLSDAFVEIDREIALALKGHKVADADAPYHDDEPSSVENHDSKPVGDRDANMHDMQQGEEMGPSALDGDSGTTACVVMIAPDWIICANAGDTRAVLSRQGHKAVALSYDHKPSNDDEERRIRAAGGYVAGGRVEADLAVSRGLGDYRFKDFEVVMAAENTNGDSYSDDVGRARPTMKPGEQKVSPIPDFMVVNRNPSQDEFLILACDGIWDVLTNYEAVNAVAEMFQEGESDLGLICEEICDQCLSMGSKDNMTATVIKFPAQRVGEGGGVLARRQLRDPDGVANNRGNSES